MTKHILNINDLEFKAPANAVPDGLKEKYGAEMGQIGAVIGAEKLGYNVTEVPAGKRAFPAHNHHVNEEMFFILEGAGEVRIGDERFPIKKGDVIACPPGGKERAHQIINTSNGELKYLAVSTKLAPEIIEYPDSDKFAMRSDALRFTGKFDQSMGYWDGE